MTTSDQGLGDSNCELVSETELFRNPEESFGQFVLYGGSGRDAQESKVGQQWKFSTSSQALTGNLNKLHQRSGRNKFDMENLSDAERVKIRRLMQQAAVSRIRGVIRQAASLKINSDK